MAVRITITPSKEDERKIVDAFRRMEAVAKSPRGPLGRTGLYLQRGAQRLLRARPKDWGPRSLRLSKSIVIRLDDNSVAVGSNLVYAAIQQLGGVVRAKKKFLALPVDPTIRRRGVWPRDLPRNTLKYVPNAEIRIGNHSWTGPALVRAKDVLIDSPIDGAGKKKKGRGRKGKKGEVLFALVRKVTIIGRPFLVFDDKARDFLLGEIEKAMTRAAGGGR